MGPKMMMMKTLVRMVTMVMVVRIVVVANVKALRKRPNLISH